MITPGSAVRRLEWVADARAWRSLDHHVQTAELSVKDVFLVVARENMVPRTRVLLLGQSGFCWVLETTCRLIT